MTAIIGGPAQHRAHRDAAWPLHDACVDSSALVEAYVVVSAGTFRPTVVGARTWIMCHSHVGHDTVIGADCEISAGVMICGECRIGEGVKIGAGAVLRPRVTVGDGAQIGAGAVVVKDIPAGEVWVGNPARFLRPATHWHGNEVDSTLTAGEAQGGDDAPATSPEPDDLWSYWIKQWKARDEARAQLLELISHNH